MPDYEIHIGEVSDASVEPVKPNEPTPYLRSVALAREVADEDAARTAAWAAWGHKYGPGRQPVQAIVKVTLYT